MAARGQTGERQPAPPGSQLPATKHPRWRKCFGVQTTRARAFCTDSGRGCDASARGVPTFSRFAAGRRPSAAQLGAGALPGAPPKHPVGENVSVCKPRGRARPARIRGGAAMLPLVVCLHFPVLWPEGAPPPPNLERVRSPAHRLSTPVGENVSVCKPRGRARPCLLYTSPSPRDKRQSRMPSSA